MLYEAYGPGGSAVVIDVLTDNKNRTASEIRCLLDRNNAKLAALGSVTYLFKRRGTVVFEAGTVDEEKLLDAALAAGAEDLRSEADTLTVLTEPATFIAVKEALEKQGFAPATSEIAMLPETMIRLEGKEAKALFRLINALEDHDDVQNVYVNVDIDDEVYEKFAEYPVLPRSDCAPVVQSTWGTCRLTRKHTACGATDRCPKSISLPWRRPSSRQACRAKCQSPPASTGNLFRSSKRTLSPRGSDQQRGADHLQRQGLPRIWSGCAPVVARTSSLSRKGSRCQPLAPTASLKKKTRAQVNTDEQQLRVSPLGHEDQLTRHGSRPGAPLDRGSVWPSARSFSDSEAARPPLFRR